jgi:ribosomal protein L37AE/L43A
MRHGGRLPLTRAPARTINSAGVPPAQEPSHRKPAVTGFALAQTLGGIGFSDIRPPSSVGQSGPTEPRRNSGKFMEGYAAKNGLPIWAPRVSRRSIAKLYQADARGIRESDLVDEVGIALLARCQSIMRIDAARGGTYECPNCLATWKQSRNNRKVLSCQGCGWSITWEQFKTTYQRKQLSAGGARPFFEEFAVRYPKAGTYTEKMALVDTLIHRFHSELDADDPPTRPAAVNLIQGTMKHVIAFLNDLTYDKNSTVGTRQTLSDWRDKWNSSYFMEEKQKKGDGKRLKRLTSTKEESD